MIRRYIVFVGGGVISDTFSLTIDWGLNSRVD